jgi:hypothetical protein
MGPWPGITLMSGFTRRAPGLTVIMPRVLPPLSGSTKEHAVEEVVAQVHHVDLVKNTNVSPSVAGRRAGAASSFVRSRLGERDHGQRHRGRGRLVGPPLKIVGHRTRAFVVGDDGGGLPEDGIAVRVVAVPLRVEHKRTGLGDFGGRPGS